MKIQEGCPNLKLCKTKSKKKNNKFKKKKKNLWFLFFVPFF
jgi:hypothetical protein